LINYENHKLIQELFMKQHIFKSVPGQRYIALLLMIFSLSSYAESEVGNLQLAKKLNQTWDQSFNKSDAKAIVALYSETAVVSPGNGQVLKGQEAIENLFQSFLDNDVHSHSIDVVEVYRDGDTLYQVSNWQASGKEQDGVIPTFGGVVTLVSKLNEQGEWKLQVHSWNMKN
jgi:uncharacterized protein (TIGR02246 family)